MEGEGVGGDTEFGVAFAAWLRWLEVGPEERVMKMAVWYLERGVGHLYEEVSWLLRSENGGRSSLELMIMDSSIYL